MTQSLDLGASEHGTIVMRVGDIEVRVWKELTLQSHFLSPTDSFHAVLGDEQLSKHLLSKLVAGTKVQFLIDELPQFTGYLTAVDSSGDRSTGNILTIEGYDMMWPLVDSQIDPNVKYPEKTPLSKLIEDIARPFGFNDFAIDNTANVDVATRKQAGKKRRRRRQQKALNAYKLPKKKPEHNDTYFQFLSRFLNRVGLWMWPSVDGNVLVVSVPDYDQEPLYSIRRRFDGQGNNVLRGGIRKDASEQPTFIVARGNIPARTVEHGRLRVVVDNPYVAGLELGLTMQEQDKALGRNRLPSPLDPEIGPPSPPTFGPSILESEIPVFNTGVDTGESLTFVSTMRRFHTEMVGKWTETIPVQPIKTQTSTNVFAATVAKPRFLKDNDSHTLEELEHFARRQMSLCTRKACVGRYVVRGFKLNGVPIQVDTIVDVDDDLADWHEPMWLCGRTINISRSGGSTTNIEVLPIGAIQL